MRKITPRSSLLPLSDMLQWLTTNLFFAHVVPPKTSNFWCANAHTSVVCVCVRLTFLGRSTMAPNLNIIILSWYYRINWFNRRWSAAAVRFFFCTRFLAFHRYILNVYVVMGISHWVFKYKYNIMYNVCIPSHANGSANYFVRNVFDTITCCCYGIHMYFMHGVHGIQSATLTLLLDE